MAVCLSTTSTVYFYFFCEHRLELVSAVLKRSLVASSGPHRLYNDLRFLTKCGLRSNSHSRHWW